MLLCGYVNVIALVNANKNEIVSKVRLDQKVDINKMIRINNMFGMFSVMCVVNNKYTEK